MEEESRPVKKPVMKENIAGFLCYLFWWVSGIVFLLLEKDNKFIRFHAMQSVITFGAVTLVYLVVSIIDRVIIYTAAWNVRGFFVFMDILDSFVLLFTFTAFILWLLLMVKAVQGEYFKLPVIGDIAEDNITL